MSKATSNAAGAATSEPAVGLDLALQMAIRRAMGGIVRAQDFHCVTADISAAMGGEARVFATRTFDATAAMGGTVNIAGGAHGDTTAVMGGSVRIADGGKADSRTAVMGGEVHD